MKTSILKILRLYHFVGLIIFYQIWNYLFSSNYKTHNNANDLENTYLNSLPIILIGPKNPIINKNFESIYMNEKNRIERFQNTTGNKLKTLTFTDAANRYPSTVQQPEYIILHKPDAGACKDYANEFAWPSHLIDAELKSCIEKGQFSSDTCRIVSDYFLYDPHLPHNSNPNFKNLRLKAINRKRTFLELGALGGLPDQSMTLVFERVFGNTWKGIGIEATPANFGQLMMNRPCIYKAEVAAGKEWGTTQFTGWGGCCSGIDTDMNPKHKKVFHGGVQSFTVGTAPVSDVLLGAGVVVLDFWVLDVEGGELSVLKGMNFKDVKVQMLLIEVDRKTPKYNEIADIMGKNGFFEDLKHFKSWHNLNTLWINRDAEPWIYERYLAFSPNWEA